MNQGGQNISKKQQFFQQLINRILFAQLYQLWKERLQILTVKPHIEPVLLDYLAPYDSRKILQITLVQGGEADSELLLLNQSTEIDIMTNEETQQNQDISQAQQPNASPNVATCPPPNQNPAADSAQKEFKEIKEALAGADREWRLPKADDKALKSEPKL
jgi:hypothetical protein